MTLSRLRPKTTISELLLNPTEKNINPLSIYGTIVDWAEVVGEAVELIVQSLASAEQARRSPSPEEKQRLITLVKRVLIDFHRDLASLFQNYRHNWRHTYIADAAEIQSHLQACIDALDPKVHLRLNANLVYHAVSQNTLNLINKQAKKIRAYTPESSSLIIKFDQSGKNAQARIDQLENQLLQLVDV